MGKGVESTTRFRQKPVTGRGATPELVDAKRQRSGRRGGRATRRSALLRKAAHNTDHEIQHGHYLRSGRNDDSNNTSPAFSGGPSSPSPNLSNMSNLPYYLNTPMSQFSRSISPFLVEDIDTYASLPLSQEPLGNLSGIQEPLFGDEQEGNASGNVSFHE